MAYPAPASRLDIYNTINGERNYQDVRYPNQKHELLVWVVLIEYYAREARYAVVKNANVIALHKLRKVAALAVKAMEQHGVEERE